MLTILDALPDGLLDSAATDLHRVLNGPTLIHLPGRVPEPLFVSVLLHGNEDVGWQAVRLLLQKYADAPLPRALSILIGNVAAARHGQRHLPEQADYNRIWLPGDTPEHGLARQVLDEMGRRQVFASVDVHNNTGINPHYACVNRLDQRFLQLATLFGRIVVYFIRPEGVQTAAFAELCPAVTLECGKVGQAHGVEHALAYLEACLHLTEIPDRPVPAHDIDLFHSVAIVKVPEALSFSTDGQDADICFVDDLDHLNFRELPANTTLGWVESNVDAGLEVWDEKGRDIGRRFLTVADNRICTTAAVIPSMLTLNADIIRQDCLCYFMERIDLGYAAHEGGAGQAAAKS